MNKLFFSVLFSSTFFLHSQETVTSQLDSITNTFQAEEYLLSLNSKENKFIIFNQEKHKTALAEKLFSRSSGGTFVVENEVEKVHYKIVETSFITHYRVSYIYLDGKKLPESEISALRRSIMSQYKDGVPFDYLAKKYSMDGNANRGGDLGWFAKGEMHPIFEDTIIGTTANVDDTFTVDIEDRQWYYVVLKTFEPKDIKEIKVLKVVEHKS